MHDDRGMAMYLAMNDVTGDCERPEFRGQMEVLAWSWGMSGDPSCGERPPSLHDLSLTKYQDGATAQLMAALARKRRIAQAVLTVVRREAPDRPYLKITLGNVHVTSVSMGGSGGEDRFTENITLSFELVRFENARITGADAGKYLAPFTYEPQPARDPLELIEPT